MLQTKDFGSILVSYHLSDDNDDTKYTLMLL